MFIPMRTIGPKVAADAYVPVDHEYRVKCGEKERKISEELALYCSHT